VQHSDPEALALVALGETPSTADAEHLRGCVECQDEVAGFSRVVSGVRVDAADVADAPPMAPPARVWDAIAAGTGVAVAPRPERVVGAPAAPADAPAARPLGLVRVRDGDRAAAVRSRKDLRGGGGRRGDRRLLLAVAASLVVGAACGVLGSSLLDRNDPAATQATQVLAQVDLKNLKDTAATGHALVVKTPTGPHIRVDTSKLAPEQGAFYEVWLIDKDVKKMVGIGILHPGEDEFAVPNGVDLSQYPIVDISVQQPGDPKHSGDSVLRGTIAG
jgi:hypothetical protein